MTSTSDQTIRNRIDIFVIGNIVADVVMLILLFLGSSLGEWYGFAVLSSFYLLKLSLGLLDDHQPAPTTTSVTNQVFRNRLDYFVIFNICYSLIVTILLFSWMFWEDWYGLAFILVFTFLEMIFSIVDNVRCEYRIQDGYLYVKEYSWLFRKKEIEIPLRFITDVKLLRRFGSLSTRKIKIYVGKTTYKLKAYSCQYELYNALKSITCSHG